MDRSRFLAGLIGPTLAVISLGLLLNLARLPELVDQLSAGWALIMIAGVVTLMAGLAVVLSHNVWKGWPAIVTAFGWLAVVGGTARILFPSQIADIAPTLITGGGPLVPVLIGVCLLLGLFLSWQAFRPVRA
ncbi:hypothetical protein [Brevundimonas sp.]|uniref:hypothetical protein n=1 Tax=Brevundimonas sp. TaxID=1871086 RepID=UPI002CF2C93A|nr:hypothetical protein [Brevundimonas sp.]HWQ86644.1 hypothetical protein [Brevundimonas sp.]